MPNPLFRSPCPTDEPKQMRPLNAIFDATGFETGILVHLKKDLACDCSVLKTASKMREIFKGEQPLRNIAGGRTAGEVTRHLLGLLFLVP